MTVKCPNCEWSAEVPDEKIPAGGRKGTCPKCQTKFEVHKDAKPLIEEPPVLSSPTQRDTRVCPLCGEEILSVAKKCKHCQSMIDDAKEETPVTQSNQDNQSMTNFTLFCPKCKTEQPVSDICIKCGIVFSKLAKNQPIKDATLESCSGRCSDCGEILDNDRGFCTKCGVLQARSVATIGSENTSRSFNPKVIFIALIGVVILLVTLNLFNSSQGQHKEVTTTYEGTVLDARISGLETGVVTTKGTFTVEEINAYVQRGQEAYFNEATGQLTVGRLTYKARRGLI